MTFLPHLCCANRQCSWRSYVWPDAQPVRRLSMSSTTCWPVGMPPSGEMGWGSNGAVDPLDCGPLTRIVGLASFWPTVPVPITCFVLAPSWALGVVRL